MNKKTILALAVAAVFLSGCNNEKTVGVIKQFSTMQHHVDIANKMMAALIEP